LSRDVGDALYDLTKIQERGLEKLLEAVSEGTSEIATVIEWGFQEIGWRLQQQTDILRSIDHTLKTPSETQATEWRRMAEELRNRGVLDKSEELFLKALDLNPLDYRIYVGLAETYLRANQFDKARASLEKSLPHAPKKQQLDFKSYSYRLIGHIYACEEDYGQAVVALRAAVEFSPDYEDAHYDYAQYCALVGEKEGCLASLQKAVTTRRFYFYLAEKERNFDPLRPDVQALLTQVSTKAFDEASATIAATESALKAAAEASPKACETFKEQVVAFGSEYGYKKLKEAVKKLMQYFPDYDKFEPALRSVGIGGRLKDYHASSTAVEAINQKVNDIYHEWQELIGDVLKRRLGYRAEHEYDPYVPWPLFKKMARRKEHSDRCSKIKMLIGQLEEDLEKPYTVKFNSEDTYAEAEARLNLAREILLSRDYKALVEAEIKALEARTLANKAREEALKEREALKKWQVI
jgi:tetratricopeptide (TPR) repeat protein